MIKLINTLTGKKEEFVPMSSEGGSASGGKDKRVHMFVCGPTVYDFSHIGHAKTYIFFDIAAKHLRYLGYKVTYLMNITDVDDKIIDKAQKEGKSTKDIAKYYEKLFFEDLKKLKIDSISKVARATDYIKEIIGQIKTLDEKGYAYKTGDGIYFDISKFDDYGKLAKRTVEQAEDAVSRIDESVSKKNRGDFALWRFSKVNEPAWDSPWGKGRPGWHIEDTAITEYHFGPQYDIHGGAVDLIFPHHEAEIAQQESASGKKPFVKYWLHPGLLTINGRKMSKSLGNFLTIMDLLKRYVPEVIRFMSLSAHYRAPLDYNEKIVEQSEAGVSRVCEFIQKLNLASGRGKENAGERIEKARQKFLEAMNDDLNTPQAFAAVFDLIRDLNAALTRNSLDKKSIKSVKKFMKEVDSILGIIPSKQEKIPDEVLELVEKRENYRKEKNWKEADKIRTQIADLGYKVEDTVYGSLVRKSVF